MDIKIAVEKNSFIDDEKLFRALVFLMEEFFNPFRSKSFKFIVDVRTSNDEGIESCGICFYDKDQHALVAMIFLDSINKYKDQYYDSIEKSILHTILHEAAHALYHIQNWNPKKETLMKSYTRLMEQQQPNPNKDEIYNWLTNPSEQYAEQFALRNIQYFVNIWEYKGHLPVAMSKR